MHQHSPKQDYHSSLENAAYILLHLEVCKIEGNTRQRNSRYFQWYWYQARVLGWSLYFTNTGENSQPQVWRLVISFSHSHASLLWKPFYLTFFFPGMYTEVFLLGTIRLKGMKEAGSVRYFDENMLKWTSGVWAQWKPRN